MKRIWLCVTAFLVVAANGQYQVAALAPYKQRFGCISSL